MSIADNVARIRREMEDAAIAAGRDPNEITLCAATKMNDAAAVREAIAAGITCGGENRFSCWAVAVTRSPSGCKIFLVLASFFINIASHAYAFQKSMDYFIDYLPFSPLHFSFFLLEWW